ncbi:response regulator transcription factor [Microbacterium sp. A94]
MRLVHDGWRFGIHDDISLLSAATAHVQGTLATALSDYAGALQGDDDALQRALTTHRDADHTLFAAELAQASLRLAREGKRPRPVPSIVTTAADRLAELGEVDTPILGRTRVDRTVLSEREFEVSRRAASGQTSPEIAQALFLSVRTVEGHLQRAFRKLGVAGRQQLAPPRAES